MPEENIHNTQNIPGEIFKKLVDVKNFLLTEKYNTLTSFISSPYFKIENIKRYQTYFDKTSYTSDIVVLYVEIGLDNNFYTNIKNTDLSKEELMIVNKYNSLTSEYIPELKTLNTKYGSGQLEQKTYDAFIKMCDEALLDNITLKSIHRLFSPTGIIRCFLLIQQPP